MDISLRELLAIPALQGIEILAGERGVDRRQVSSVTVMDAPDPYRWIQGGELVVTSGYIFRDNPLSILDAIEKLNERESSGFGIKVQRYVKTVPPEALALADKLAFPLLDIPFSFAFRDVIDPVLTSIVNRQARAIKFSEQVLTSFSKMVTVGAGEEEICASLRKFAKCGLVFCDTTFGEFHFAADDDFVRIVRSTPLHDLLRRFLSVKIAIGERVYGYLVFQLPPSSSPEGHWFTPVSHAQTALLLCLQKRLAHAETERRYRSEFVLDILNKNLRFEKELWNRAALLDWDIRGPRYVVVVDIDNYKRQFEEVDGQEAMRTIEETKRRIYTISNTVIRSSFPRVPFTEMSDSVAYILPAPPLESAVERVLSPVLKTLQEEILNATGKSVTIGAGRVKQSVLQSSESYDEACRALEMVRSAQGPGKIAFWDRLGVNKLLFGLPDSSAARDFCREILAPLLDLEESNRETLLKTLTALSESNWSVKASSRLLGIHENTVKYRYKRIREMLGFNPDSSEERLRLALALKILSLEISGSYSSRTK
jgi:purine catabolism regulator